MYMTMNRIGVARTHIVTPTIKKRIASLVEKGKTVAEISRKLGMSYCGVYYWVKPGYREIHQANMVSLYHVRKDAEEKKQKQLERLARKIKLAKLAAKGKDKNKDTSKTKGRGKKCS